MSGVISPEGYGYGQGFDPSRAIGWMQGLQNLQRSRFELGQEQLQPTYAALSAALENPNLTYDDLNSAVAESVRLGANPAGMMQNIQEMAARGYSPRDIATQLGTLRYAPAFEGAEMVMPRFAEMQTPGGTYYGTRAGAGTATPFAFTPFGGGGAGDGTNLLMPGGGTSGGAGYTGGGQFMPVTQALAGPESGNRNIPGPYTGRGGYASGVLQIADNTWREHAAGVPGASQYARAMDAPPDMQQAVANTIPLGEWATLPQVRQQFPWVTPAMTLGEANRIAMAGGANAPAASGANFPTAPSSGGGNVIPASGPGTGGASVIPASATTGGQSQGGAPTMPASPYGAYAVDPRSGFIPNVPPWVQQSWTASNQQFNADRSMALNLPQRLTNLTQALGTIRANPTLQFGPGSEDAQNLANALHYLGWQGSAADLQNAKGFQEVNKELRRYVGNIPGAERSDLGAIDAKLSNPSVANTRSALIDLIARSVGLERMRAAGYMHFMSQYGPNAPAFSNTYADQITPYMQHLDPVGFAYDQMTPPERREYYNDLNKQGQANYEDSIAEASRLYGLGMPSTAQPGAPAGPAAGGASASY